MNLAELERLKGDELRDLRDRIDLQLERLEKEELDAAVQTLRDVAARRDQPFLDLIREIATPVSRQKTLNAPYRVKYRHPSKPNLVWSGRGRPPRWVLEHEENGGSREDLLLV